MRDFYRMRQDGEKVEKGEGESESDESHALIFKINSTFLKCFATVAAAPCITTSWRRRDAVRAAYFSITVAAAAAAAAATAAAVAAAVTAADAAATGAAVVICHTPLILY